ncbi:carboxypeptidase-like regulatory domain-containing protein [Nucisporomicrobium flavum]|uniref:carboxypeptidase-like regulatory domain-containing protein n=1 Tax=Nucisporomicrobium flavum TaxID=2785915 RepID=UPI0018F561BC|nr:carboxypeptidase-like regulatory domain-containing protein [Nucisporomicrobium flavum]
MKRPRSLISAIAAVLLAGTAAATTAGGPAAAQPGSTGLAGVVRDTRGAAVSGATIIVYPADLSGSEAGRGTTGSTGRFRVPDLQAGTYKIVIDRDGWSEWAPGRITDPARAASYRVVTGHTTMANSVVTAPGFIAGRVTTSRGGPAAGIAVNVGDPTLSSWDTTTARDGTYAFSLPPGTGYVVSFTNGQLTQYSRRTLEWAQAEHYTVTSGRTTRVDERLLPPAVLTGRLTDESGTPVADAGVEVTMVATASTARTTTGADGRYLFEALPPGEVVVGFTASGGRSQWAYQKRSMSDADLFTLHLGTVTTVDDTLLPAIPDGAIAGLVTTATGGPAAGITVTIDEPTLSSWDTTTAADGTYSVSLPPGSGYTVSFTNGKLTQYSPRTLDWSQAQRYTVMSGVTTRVDETLLAPAVLTGRFVDASGTPIAGAGVYVSMSATAGSVQATTGTDGRYLFAAMPPGDVVIGFTAPGHPEQWAYGKTDGALADHFTLSLGTVTTVDDTLLPLPAPAR